MNQKNIKQFLFSAVAIPFLFACNNGQNNKEIMQKKYNWQEQHVISFSDVNNTLQEFSSEDIEALDTSFINLLFSEILTREDVEFLDTDEKKITSQQVKEILNKKIVVQVEDPDNPGVFSEVEDTVKIQPEEVIQVLCREKWNFDTKGLKLQKTITHIAPVIYTYDQDGDIRGKRSLFWIKMN